MSTLIFASFMAKSFVRRILSIHVGYHCFAGYKTSESFGESDRNAISDVPKKDVTVFDISV